MGSTLHAILEEQREDLLDFACRLISAKSLTCQEEAAAEIAFAEMKKLGYEEISTDEMGNVLGRMGTGDPLLLFDSHLDTVTVNDENLWESEPFKATIRRDCIYGRGAADMKCGLAASLYGIAAARQAGRLKDGSIYMSASTMEEDYDGYALKYLLEKTGLRPKGVVLCEPTGLSIAVGHRGRALIEVAAEGKSAHASTPERGRNPVYMLAPVIARIGDLNRQLSREKGEHGSVALTNIRCNTASNNSVPQDATLILDRRLALGEDEEKIAKEMDALLDGTDCVWRFSDITGTSYKGTSYLFHSFLPAWEIKEEDPLVVAAKKACAEAGVNAPAVFKMGCSTNGVTSAGIFALPSIVLGPGHIEMAHARDEFCPIDELFSAAEIYAHLSAGGL